MSTAHPGNSSPQRDGAPAQSHENLLEEVPDQGLTRRGCVMTRPHEESPPVESSEGNAVQTLESTIAFESVQIPLMEVINLLQAVERKMEDLKDRFNDSVPKTLLRLRPWPRRKGEQPYALYWIFFRRIRPTFDSRTFRQVENRKPRRFRRLKIRNRTDLSEFIHLARLDAHKFLVLRFHDRAQALNEAHRILARALDSVRKMVSGRVSADAHCPPFPDARFPFLAPRFYPWVERLWRVGWSLRKRSLELFALARENGLECRGHRYRLRFIEDPDHPYGRLLWRDELSRVSHSSLPDRERRKLRVPPEERRAIAVYERPRRLLTRRLRELTTFMKRIRLKLGHALKVGREASERGRILSRFSYLEVP